MTLFFRKVSTVAGIHIPRRCFTKWAALYFVMFVCLPVLVMAFILDVIFYEIFRHFFDACYGLMCLFN